MPGAAVLSTTGQPRSAAAAWRPPAWTRSRVPGVGMPYAASRSVRSTGFRDGRCVPPRPARRSSGAGRSTASLQVAQRQQPVAEPLEHGHAGCAEPVGRGLVDTRRQTGQHDDGLVGGRHDVEDGVGVGGVAVVLGHQVDRQGGDADRGVGGDRRPGSRRTARGCRRHRPTRRAGCRARGRRRAGARALRAWSSPSGRERARRAGGRGRRPGCARPRSRGRWPAHRRVADAAARRGRRGCRRAPRGRRRGGRRRRRTAPPTRPNRRPPRRNVRRPWPSRGASGRRAAAPPRCRPRGRGAATSGAGRRRGWSRAPARAPASRCGRRRGRRSRPWWSPAPGPTTPRGRSPAAAGCAAGWRTPSRSG